MMVFRSHGARGGFTLIEVMAALVVFSAGVLMVLGLTETLAGRLSAAGIRTRVSVEVQNRLDSLQSLPYDSLSTGTSSDIVLIQGRAFNRTQRILQSTPLVKEVEVTLTPVEGGSPRLTSSAFIIRAW